MSINETRRVLHLREQFIADNGNYFMVQNPTPGTGFAQNIQTSYSATTAFITIYNGSGQSTVVPASSTPMFKRIYLDYIRLICSAAGSTTTSAHAVFTLDNGNRYSSGETSNPTPWNVLLDPSQPPPASTVATVNIGPITATAASSSVIKVGRSVLRVASAPAWAVFDEVLFHFGNENITQPQAVTATTASRIDVFMPPAIVGPGCTFLYQPYNVANATTAPSFEYEIGWFEY